MAKLFNLEIITPERTFYRGEVESVIVNTVGGQMGVLKGNAPLVTALVSGDLKIQKDGKWYHAANSNGFMEVTPEKVIISPKFRSCARWRNSASSTNTKTAPCWTDKNKTAVQAVFCFERAIVISFDSGGVIWAI